MNLPPHVDSHPDQEDDKVTLNLRAHTLFNDLRHRLFSTLATMSSLLTWLTERHPNVNAVDMAQKKATYHHGDLLVQIERIAWEKVRESGADNLSLRSCARDAGVDPAAVYRHFKSKDALLARLASKAFSELAQAMEAGEARFVEIDPKGALVQIGMAYIGYAVREPHIFQMMFDIAGRCKRDGIAGFVIEDRSAHGILVNAVERLQPTFDQDVHVFTLWSVVHGFAKLANSGLGPAPDDLEHLAHALCENVAELIR